VKGKIITRIAR